MNLLFASLLWFPHFGGTVETGHDLGLEPDLRGVIGLDVSIGVVAGRSWLLDLCAANRTYVRANGPDETFFRISPQQAHYSVGSRLRFSTTGSRQEWALFARHQSNHDVDTSDPVLNRETISFEVYGAQLLGPGYELEAGVYYDRGTRLDGSRQDWPFNYFLGGLRAQLEWSATRNIYTGADIELVGHRNKHSQIPYVDVGGHLDVGWLFRGRHGRGRTFLRLQRLNNYQHLGDEPRYLLLIGVGIDGRSRTKHSE